MPIVRLDDKGKRLGRAAKVGAVLAVGVVIAGAVLFYRGDEALGVLVAILGTSLASVWNLADNS
jgi:hypothetical protein